MSNEARREYLDRIWDRYKKADKQAKGAILEEFCQVCDYNRKYAIRLLNHGRPPSERPGKTGKPRFYSDSLNPHLKYLAGKMESVGAKRMKAAIPLWLKYYDSAPGAPELTERDRHKLMRMSASTIARRMKAISSRGISGTKVNQFLKSSIPISIGDYRVKKPGWMQGDTVLHCGMSVHGKYANTVTAVDLASSWTANRAVWTKDSLGVKRAVEDIENKLPFTLYAWTSDGGTEFINHRMFTYFRERRKPIDMSRTRPYESNDNGYVEQKNWTHVRQLFGYDRVEQEDLVELMNEIYEKYWNPLHNFFLPSMKIKEKKRVGPKIRKVFDKPKTPAQRLLESADLSNYQKQKLRAQMNSLNPFKLRADLEDKLREYFKLLRAKKHHKLAA